MNFIELLNHWGPQVLTLAGRILWQSSLLIAFMLLLDWALRHRLRPGLRYMLWLVVLLKLVLPPSLALPSGVAWWLRAPASVKSAQPTAVKITYGTDATRIAQPTCVVKSAKPAAALSFAGGLLGVAAGISAGLFGAMLWRWQRFSRQTSADNCITAPDWLAEMAAEAAGTAGVRRSVGTRVIAAPLSPALFGLLSPVILLPQSLVAGLSADRLRTVLIHEFIHLRRGDVWVNCMQTLLQIIYWWHPLLWVANYRIRRAREEAVDEAVMIALRDEADAYAPTLLDVARLALHPPFVSLGLVGILEPCRALRHRIERLITFTPPGRPRSGVAALLCVLVFGAIALPMGRAPAADAGPQAANKQRPAAIAQGAVKPKIDAQIVLGEAKLLYDSGKIEEAEKKFNLALQHDPSSQAAYYYLDLIKESKWMQQRSGMRNVTSGRQRIHGKLDTLRVDKLKFENAALRDVLKWLTVESKRLDTAGAGIKFIMNRASREQVEAVALEDVRIGMALPLSNLRLVDVLDVIVKAADKPLKYSIEDYGVVFAFRANQAPALHTRIFKVDPNTFKSSLQPISRNDNITAALREFLASINVELAPPKNIFFNDREGTLIVRATVEDLKSIEAAISVLNTTPLQLNVRATFIALSEAEWKAFWEGYKGMRGSPWSLQLGNREAENELKKWKSLDPNCLLSEASVTTLSGRQCQIQVLDEVTSRKSLEITNELPVGVTLDVLPTLLADKLRIELAMTARVNEFLGDSNLALPRFRLRECTLTAAVQDSQTLIFGLKDNADDASLHRPGESKRLLVMVTPVIVDAAGNRIRSN